MNSEKKMQKVQLIREGLDHLEEAKQCFEAAHMYVDAMNIDTIMQKKQRALDFYIAEHFPIVERKTTK